MKWRIAHLQIFNLEKFDEFSQRFLRIFTRGGSRSRPEQNHRFARQAEKKQLCVAFARQIVNSGSWEGVQMASDKQNLQDVFLNAIRKSKGNVTIFLVNGVKLSGIVTSFDNYCLLLRKDSLSQLIYKHAISTILPSQPVNLFTENQDDE